MITEQATEVLRQRYRQMLDNSDGSEPVRGFEFLAYLEHGSTHEETSAADPTESTDDDEDGETVIVEESDAASEIEGAAAFNPGFMFPRH